MLASLLCFNALCFGMLSCGDIESDQAPVFTPVPHPDIVSSFGEDYFAIGPYWYFYDLGTHTLLEHDFVYYLHNEAQNLDALLEVESYYSEDGETGLMRLKIAHWDGSTWQETPYTFSRVIDATPYCLDLDPIAEVSCENSEWDIVVHTIKRPMPTAGFAYSDPNILARGHFTTPELNVNVRMIGDLEHPMNISDVSDSPSALQEREITLDTRRLVESGVIGREIIDSELGASHIYVQLTSDLRFAQWQIDTLSETNEETILSFSTRCEAMKSSFGQQSPIDQEVVTSTVSIPYDGSYSVGLVDLCNDSGANLIETQNEPYAGFWPETSTFDLIIERVEDGVSIRLSPGSNLWDWTLWDREYGENLGSTEFHPVQPLEEIWL